MLVEVSMLLPEISVVWVLLVIDFVLIIGVSFEINARSGTSIPPSTPEMDVSPMIQSML